LGAWDIFKDAVFAVINWFYSWCGDWGLAIILITILFRIIIYPITRKQFQSSYKMQKLQPQMKAIREKYKDDPQRQQQETMKLYQEAKFNPLSGCLPMLLQMPIFIALYQALQELVFRLGIEYLPADSPFAGKTPGELSGISPTDFGFPDAQTSAEAFKMLMPSGVDITPSFFGIIPDLAGSPSSVFFGQGLLPAIPYVILMLLFSVSMLVPMLINKQSDRQTRIMMIVMSVFMLWIGWSAPAGVLLYWDASSLLGMAQQYGSRYFMEKKDERQEAEHIDVEPVKVDIERKERKARPRKKN
jgi:YidC/Oxa1 family membrane protein insertase